MGMTVYRQETSPHAALMDYWLRLWEPWLGDSKRFRYLDVLNQVETPQVTWSTPNNIIYEHQTLRLRHFPNRRDAGDKRPVLILPPQAGHHSCLADYSPAQSLVRVFQSYGFDVYVTEWISATRKYKDLGMEDYIRLTDEAVDQVRERTGRYKIHIVGQCQGGWQATVYTSLFQDKIATLVSAAAPIDLAAAPSPIVEDSKLPMEFFEYMVATHNGLMDGYFMLLGF
ncbi:MAG: alpha/beta fold hydrolase, partial [Candidatus Saccharibacteria bacterium]